MLAFLLACQPIGTTVDDAGNPIWNADITLDADVTVAAGETLTIEPGVTVTLAEGAALLVDGELNARGTADAPIVFTGDAAARWRSIVFGGDAVDAAFEGVDVFAGGSMVEHAVVEPLEAGREQRDALLGRELLDELLVELAALGGERDHPGRRPAAVDRLERGVDDVDAQEHSGPAAVGLVIDLAGAKRREVPVAEQAQVEPRAEDGGERALLRHPGERVRNEGEDVDLHPGRRA